MRFLFGINPALAALRARPHGVERVYLAEGASQGALRELFARAREAGIRVDRVPRPRLDRMTSGAVHQGVVLEVKEYEYVEPSDLVERAKSSGEPALIVVLDGILDPQNLGAIVRSALAFGAHGVVIPRDRAASVTAVVAKAAAGALEHLPVARATNLAATIGDLRDRGIWTAAADPTADRTPENLDLSGPAAIVVGSEGKGVRRLVLERCDDRVRIPIGPKTGSLNAAAAAAVLLYEASRQRRAKPR